jgi:hypothetical protein
MMVLAITMAKHFAAASSEILFAREFESPSKWTESRQLGHHSWRRLLGDWLEPSTFHSQGSDNFSLFNLLKIEVVNIQRGRT